MEGRHPLAMVNTPRLFISPLVNNGVVKKWSESDASTPAKDICGACWICARGLMARCPTLLTVHAAPVTAGVFRPYSDPSRRFRVNVCLPPISDRALVVAARNPELIVDDDDADAPVLLLLDDP